MRTTAAALCGILLSTLAPPSHAHKWSVECTEGRACHLQYIDYKYLKALEVAGLDKDEAMSRFTCRNDMDPPLIARYKRNGIKIVDKEPMTVLRQLIDGVNPVQLQLTQSAKMEIHHELRAEYVGTLGIYRTQKEAGWFFYCQRRAVADSNGFCTIPRRGQGWKNIVMYDKDCSWANFTQSMTQEQIRRRLESHEGLDYFSYEDCIYPQGCLTNPAVTIDPHMEERDFNMYCRPQPFRSDSEGNIRNDYPFSPALEDWRYQCSVIGVDVPE